MTPLTLDDATQFIRQVLLRGDPVLLVVTQHVSGWQVTMRRTPQGSALWSAVGKSSFRTAQAALDAAMATPQITEAP